MTAVAATAGLLAVSGVTLADAAGTHDPLQEVSYLGYQVQVPASWHVYRLAGDPSRCVLFNQHAVYLGTPGTRQDCPVEAFGKTEALLIQPLAAMTSLPPQTSVQSGTNIKPPSGGMAADEATNQTLQLALPAAGVQVTATYGQDASIMNGILSSARVTGGHPAAIPQLGVPNGANQSGVSGGADQPAQAPADSPNSSSTGAPAATAPATPAPSVSATPSATPSASPSGAATPSDTATPVPTASGTAPATPAPTATGTGTVPATPAASASASPSASPSGTAGPTPAPSPQTAESTSLPTLTGGTGSGLAFDTCTVPSVDTMRSWLASPFRVAGTYLGGDNWACGYGNFSRTWVDEVAEMGWRFAPLWVGPQAPCTQASGTVTIDPSQAAAEGRAQAASAVSTAAGFGYGRGTPIYFDMEGYDNQNGSCSQTVLDFLGAWTDGLHAAGYKSGVYSSASSGISDLASQYGNRSYPKPDDIWFADWNSDPVTSDGYVPSGDWTDNQRLHQFHGPNTETFGGVGVNIDDDYADSAVAGLSATPGPYVISEPEAVSIPAGSSTEVGLVIGSSGSTSSPGAPVQWSVQVPSGLTVTPDQGTDTYTPGQTVKVSVRVTASSSARPGRYNLPVTASAGGQPATGTTELVSVDARGGLNSTQSIALYAANPSSMTAAVQVAHELDLPMGDITGSYQAAWNDAAGGHTLLLAIGQAAANALYTNPCGWSNPAHMGRGSTPFTDLSTALEWPPGRNYYEDAAGTTLADTETILGQYANYAESGIQPNQGQPAPLPSAPTDTCLGVQSVPVP